MKDLLLFQMVKNISRSRHYCAWLFCWLAVSISYCEAEETLLSVFTTKVAVADALEERLVKGVSEVDELSEKMPALIRSGKLKNEGEILYNAKSTDRLWLSEPNRSKDEVEVMPGWVERKGLEVSSLYGSDNNIDFFAKLTRMNLSRQPTLYEMKSLTTADTSSFIYARLDTSRFLGNDAIVFFSRNKGAPMKDLILVKASQYRLRSAQGRDDFIEQSGKVTTRDQIAAGISFLENKAKQINRVSVVVARALQTRVSERVPNSYKVNKDSVFAHRDIEVLLDLKYEEQDGKQTLKIFYSDIGLTGAKSLNATKRMIPEYYSGNIYEQLDDSKSGVYFFPINYSNANWYDVLVVEVTLLE